MISLQTYFWMYFYLMQLQHTARIYRLSVEAGNYATFEYSFNVHESFGGRPFGLSITVYYTLLVPAIIQNELTAVQNKFNKLTTNLSYTIYSNTYCILWCFTNYVSELQEDETHHFHTAVFNATINIREEERGFGADTYVLCFSLSKSYCSTVINRC